MAFSPQQKKKQGRPNSVSVAGESFVFLLEVGKPVCCLPQERAVGMCVYSTAVCTDEEMIARAGREGRLSDTNAHRSSERARRRLRR